MKNTTLLLTISLLLAACSDPEPADNNNVADMAVDMAPDMAPDMRPAPTGPQDCLTGEWFSTQGPRCLACPAQALGCDALILSTTSIEPGPDVVSFKLNTALLQPVSVTAVLDVVDILCTAIDPDNPDAPPMCSDQEPVEQRLAMMEVDQTWRGALMFDPLGRDAKITVKAIELVDACGTTHMLPTTGGWVVEDNMLLAPLNCVAPAP
jgi:hypothetical protein